MENNFIPGLNVFEKHPKAPDFVVCDLSLDPQKLGQFLSTQTEKYVKVQVLMSKAGKPYAKINDYKPADKPQQQSADDLPF